MLAVRELDYRVVYMMETDFENRVRDVYVAKHSHRRAPLFIDILAELVDIEAALFMLHHREAFSELSEAEYGEMYRKVEAEDMDAIHFAYSRMSEEFVECFAKDLFIYLKNNKISFLEEDFYDSNDTLSHNSAIQSVW